MVQADSSENERTVLAIPMSEAFKKAFEDWRTGHGYKTNAKVGQIALASFIGYDLRNEPEPKTRSKYGANESGRLDRLYASMRNTHKGSLQTQYLRGTLKARKEKDDARLELLDNAIVAMESSDWEPVTLEGAPDWAKRIELREKALATLIAEKDTKKGLPADYQDETLEEWRSNLPTTPTEPNE